MLRLACKLLWLQQRTAISSCKDEHLLCRHHHALAGVEACILGFFDVTCSAAEEPSVVSSHTDDIAAGCASSSICVNLC